MGRPELGRSLDRARGLAASILLLMVGCRAPVQNDASAPGLPDFPDLTYPVAGRDSTTDDYHGTLVHDPYRWLEDANSPDTRAWIEAERTLTDRVLDEIGLYHRIRERLAVLGTMGRRNRPILDGRQLYLVRTDPERSRPVIVASDSGGLEGRVVFDVNAAGLPDSLTAGSFTPSPDGRQIAYFASFAGRDLGEIRVWDVETRRHLEDRLPGVRYPLVVWLPDSRSFLYTRNDPAGEGARWDATSQGRQLVLHRSGSAQDADRILHEADAEGAWIRLFDPVLDGRYAVFTTRASGPGSPVMALSLGQTPDGVRSDPVQLLPAAVSYPIGSRGDTLFLRTTADAPNGRIVAIDLDALPQPPARTLIAEGTDAIYDAALTRDGVVVHVIRDVQSRLLLFSAEGAPAGEVPLPEPGTVGFVSGSSEAEDLFFDFHTPTSPRTIFRFDASAGELSIVDAGPEPYDGSAFETRQLFFASMDGTRVPMFLTTRRGSPRDGSTPTLIWVYGGFGTSLLPGFMPRFAAWLEMGGALAVVNVRGGGEYGESWHQAGMGPRKQTVFDDVIAAAEYLVREGWSSPQGLVLHGESNGGLTVGAVMTQRPDLFAAAVPVSGVLDMLRFHRFTVGSNWIGETGSADDPAAFPNIVAYSPLHNVRPGVCYPATLVVTGEDDDRVVPAHSYKFVAALQAAQGCDRPILLYPVAGASHMGGIAGAADPDAAMLAFAAAMTGLVPPPW